MPVKFTDGTLGQVLLRSGDVMALRQILDDLLTKPSPTENPGFGIGKPPLQVRHLEEYQHNVALGSTALAQPTIPLSVGCRPKLSGLSKSICRLVPPVEQPSQSASEGGQGIDSRTKYGPPFPVTIDGLSVLELGAGGVTWRNNSTENGLGGNKGRQLQRDSHVVTPDKRTSGVGTGAVQLDH